MIAAVDMALPSAPTMRKEVEMLSGSLALRLRAHGVHLSDEDVTAFADAVLEDAVRLALDWLEGER